MTNMTELKITDTKILGQAVRTARDSSGLSQIETAALCGVGVRFLSDLENGKPTVECEKVLKVLKGMGLELIVKQKGWK